MVQSLAMASQLPASRRAESMRPSQYVFAGSQSMTARMSASAAG